LNDADQWHNARRHKSPLAREMATLLGIRSDLEDAQRLMVEHLTVSDAAIKRGLYYAALILYRRVFKSRIRGGLDLSKMDIVGNGRRYHEYLISMADKQVAHAINPFEQIAIGFSKKDQSTVLLKIKVNQIGATEVDAHQFIDFVSGIISNILLDKFKQIEQKLLEEIKLLSEKETNKLEFLEVVIPGSNQVESVIQS
jgi:hypothetical protein